jgi:hypothetical protein
MGADVFRVPWEQVERIDTAITLKGKARDLGLGKGDDRMAERVGRLPKA